MASFDDLQSGLTELGTVITTEAQQVKDAIEAAVKAAVADAIAPLQAKVDELSSMSPTEVPQSIIDEIKALSDQVASIVEPGSPSVVPAPVDPTVVPSVDTSVPVSTGEASNTPLPDVTP